MSPSESTEEESEGSLWRIGGRVAGEAIVKGIVVSKLVMKPEFGRFFLFCVTCGM